MRLHPSLIQDMNLGVQQIHSQLEIIHLELQSLKKGREAQPEVRAEVWCLKCKKHGHDKDHSPIFKNYTIGGGHVPLRPDNNVGTSAGVALWCVIFKLQDNILLITIICCRSLYRHLNSYFVISVSQ